MVTAMATATGTAMATAMAVATAMAPATAMAVATAMAPATAMARAVVMLLLKMDENVNLRLERHVNRAFFFTVYSFPPGTSFLYFSKYWVASDTKRRGRKGS